VPSRKQRRRRAKERRHEYEYVYVDEEGREVEVEPGEVEEPRKADRRAAPRARGGRPIEPASWRRVGKRGLLFAPIMFLTISLLGRGESVIVHIRTTVFLLVVFLPFSYVMDSLLYRAYLRRTGAGRNPARRR